jgi:hypothetical protein
MNSNGVTSNYPVGVLFWPFYSLARVLFGLILGLETINTSSSFLLNLGV